MTTVGRLECVELGNEGFMVNVMSTVAGEPHIDHAVNQVDGAIAQVNGLVRQS